MNTHPKKILIVTGIFPPDIGGPATYAERLLKQLPQHGFECAVLTYGEKEANDDFRIIRVSRRIPKGIRHYLYFWKCLRLSADIILVADSSFGAAFIAVCANWFKQKKLVIRVTGDYVWEQGTQRFGVHIGMDDFQRQPISNLFLRLIKWARDFSLKYASALIAPSEYLKRIAIGWGIPESKITVIYNSFDLPDNFQLPHKNNSDITIISVGRLVVWKGFDQLIEAVNALTQKYPHLRLKIVGDGPELESLKQLCVRNSIAQSVTFLGRMDHNQLLAELGTADIFALNTGYEGFSHMILEAMAVGLPVAVSNVGGNPELIEDGETGCLFKYKNMQDLMKKLEALIQNQSLRKTMGANAIKRSRDFSSARMVERTIQMLAL